MAQNIWGAGAGSSPFFSQNSYYGADKNYWTAPIVSGNNADSLMNQNPEAVFRRITSPYAGGVDPYSKFVQSQFPQVQKGFLQAQMTNPNLRPDDYYSGLGGDDFFRRLFNLQDTRGRGLNIPNFGGGRMRWFPAV